ncbi:hypothetical protein HPB48_000080 [Haemaphysalis longicornis]|uniref:PiggyBac transposable element-derived protein domain-containing protein n=1 Tax=Haemaphysalis longicornis TaxID=44386 RepID=A0A9J6GBK1_HAELO|nr:hypothetical protein HPB48_000080 [Haemaphysalis longicornis]
MKKGEIESLHTDTLLAFKWCDKREVTALASMHGPHMQDSDKVDRVTGEKKKRPACVLDYPKKMGLVDRVDMRLSFSVSGKF